MMRSTAKPNDKQASAAVASRRRRHIDCVPPWIVRYIKMAVLGMVVWMGSPLAAVAKDTPNGVIQVAPASPSVFGTPLTFYGIVSSPTQGGPIPTGTITFARRDSSNDNHDICTVTIDTNSTIQSCAYPEGFYPPAGDDRFIIIYSGDSNYNGENTGALATEVYTIEKADVQFTVDPPAPIYVGQHAVFTFNVGSGGSLLTGNIGIEITDALTCGVPLDVGADETCTMPKQRFAGIKHSTFSYGGDDNHNPVTFDGPDLTVFRAPMALSIVASPATIPLGAGAAVTATLSSIIDPGAQLFGIVTVSDGEVSCTIDMHAASACTLTPTSAGIKHLTASYGGYSDSFDTAQATADLTVTSTAVNGVCGSDNGRSLTSTPTNLCSAGTPSAVSGSGPWNWTCNGINNGTSASCSALRQTSTSTTSLVLSPNPTTAGEPVSASVAVSAASPTSAGATVASVPAAATGSVTVNGGGATCTASLANGLGNCLLIFAAPGSYLITANYGGDGNNAPSSAVVTEVVNAAATPGTTTSAPTLDRWALWLLVSGLAAFTLFRLSRRR